MSAVRTSIATARMFDWIVKKLKKLAGLKVGCLCSRVNW